jgi:4-hydroxybenzoate polyprenyltransferase
MFPIKFSRPIASGKLSVKAGFLLFCFLGVISLLFSFMLEGSFGWLIVIYILLNLFYSKILKNMVIIDVFCIACFFTMWVISGALIARVEISHLIIFATVLLSLFLGFNKRRQEMVALGENAGLHRPVLVSYSINFIDQMIAVITGSIVVVYMLYTWTPGRSAK